MQLGALELRMCVCIVLANLSLCLINIGSACRSRVTKVLNKKFQTPQDAEKEFPRLLRASSPLQPQVHQGLKLNRFHILLYLGFCRFHP